MTKFKMGNSCSVILATYNDAENIEVLVEKLVGELKSKVHKFEIIVVDDNSPDGTFQKLLMLSQSYQMLRPVLRRFDKGLGPSVWEGIRAAKYRNIVVMESELSHCSLEIPEMISFLEEGKQIVWKNRYANSDKVSKTPEQYVKFLFGRTINYLLKKILAIPVSDSTNRFFAFRREILNSANFKYLFKGYGEFPFLLLSTLFRKKIVQTKDIIELPFVHRRVVASLSKTNRLMEGISYLFIALVARFGHSPSIKKPKSLE